MTILLTKAVRAGGVILASGSTQTLDAAVEGQLVHNGSATYVSDPSTALNDVPVTASKTLTGVVEYSIGGERYQVAGPSLTNIHAKKPSGDLAPAAANGAPGWTHAFRTTADRGFDYIRIGLVNLESVALTGVRAIVAVTETAANFNNPIVNATQDNLIRAEGTGTGWTQVTFAGESSVTLPARISTDEPSITFSDWMRIKSIPRADGGTLPLAMARFFNPSANTTQTLSDNSVGGDALSPELSWQSRQNVDGVTNPASFTSTVEGTTPNWPYIEFMSAEQGVLLYSAGDSVVKGFGLTLTQNNWITKASKAIRDSGINCSVINDGWLGRPSLNYYNRALTAIPLVLPKIAIYAPYTSNDGTPTQAIVDAQFARAVRFINFCNGVGVIPILTTPIPNGDLSGPQDIVRMQLVNRIKALTTITVIDFNAVLSTSNGDGSYSWIPSLMFNTRHPNLAGHEAMAAAAIPAIARAISRL